MQCAVSLSALYLYGNKTYDALPDVDYNGGRSPHFRPTFTSEAKSQQPECQPEGAM